MVLPVCLAVVERMTHTSQCVALTACILAHAGLYTELHVGLLQQHLGSVHSAVHAESQIRWAAAVRCAPNVEQFDHEFVGCLCCRSMYAM
jgi:hypothetical protein